MMASLMTDASNNEDQLGASTDYSKYGITDVAKPTVNTALGKTKTVAGLYRQEWLFMVLSLVNICCAGALTMVRLVQVVRDDPTSPDFTLTILLLVNAAFCVFYVLHGVLRERVYELYAFMAAIVVVLMYCILEYTVFNPSHHTVVKTVRLSLACVLAPFNIVIAWVVSRGFGFLEFRIVGASQFLQRLYRQAAIFSCLLKFDLQATSSVVVLALKEGTALSLLETLSLAVGLPFSLLWCLLGWIMLRREMRAGAVALVVTGLVKPAYYIYKIVQVYTEVSRDSESSHTITYSLLAAVAIALLVWAMLMIELVLVYNNFGKGLKQRTREVLSTETTGLLANTSRWRP